MRRACAIILFLVFTQYLIESTQAKPDPQSGNDATCGKHGDSVSTIFFLINSKASKGWNCDDEFKTQTPSLTIFVLRFCFVSYKFIY